MTNPKYKCIDELSDDANDPSKEIVENLQPSERENDFRETILKSERKRKRKERKQKEKDMKKMKQLSGEDAASKGIRTTGDTDMGTNRGEEDDDNDEEHS